MEDLQLKKDDRQYKQSQKKCSFTEEIERIQINRQKVIKQVLRNKKQFKQNLHHYITKKLIIPQALNSEPTQIISPSISILKRNSNYNKFVDKNEDNCIEDKENKLRKIKYRKRISQDLILDQSNKKWKLQITSEELNSLFFGKELRIGSKSRQNFISDNRIRQLKSASLFRTKMKSKQFKNIDLNSAKSTKNCKSIEYFQKSRKFTSINEKQAEKSLTIKQIDGMKRKCSHHLASFQQRIGSEKGNIYR